MLHRVLRTPNISDTAVTISGRHGRLVHTPDEEPVDPDEESVTSDMEETGEGELDPESGRAGEEASHEAQAPGPYEFVGPLPEGESWPDDPGEMLIGAEPADAEVAAAEVATAEVEEPEPQGLSPLEVEKRIEERLAEFEERFQREKEEAYRSGFEDGKTEGTKEGLAQSAVEIERFADLIDTVRAQWESVNKGHDVLLTDLAVALARKIVGASVQVSRDTVVRAVQDSLGYLTDKSRVVIRVHPDDLAAVREHRGQWLESLESLEQLVIESSPTIARGGCVIESPVGDVDAQIEERLERMRIALIDAIESETAEASPGDSPTPIAESGWSASGSDDAEPESDASFAVDERSVPPDSDAPNPDDASAPPPSPDVE